MMSVAGGWFFLMACEMFVLGQATTSACPGWVRICRRQPAPAIPQAILWGVGTMIAVIVLLDQIVWRPVIAWAEKFKLEQVESTDAPQSWFLDLMQHSRLLVRLRKRVFHPLRERLDLHFAREHGVEHENDRTGCRGRFGPAALIAVNRRARGVLRVVRTVGMLTGAERARVSPDHWRARARPSARAGGAGRRIAVDDSRGRGHRLQSQAGAHRPAAGADCGIGSGDGAVSHRAADADPHRRRAGHRIDRAAAAGNAVVHPVQRDRRRHGDSDRSERSVGALQVHQRRSAGAR